MSDFLSYEPLKANVAYYGHRLRKLSEPSFYTWYLTESAELESVPPGWEKTGTCRRIITNGNSEVVEFIPYGPMIKITNKEWRQK
jgi:hypothetical protein